MLEAFYAERHEDKVFVNDFKNRFEEEEMKNADLEMVSFQTGTKLMKTALVPGFNLLIAH